MLEVSEAKVVVRDCCSSEDRDLIFVLHQVDCSCPPTRLQQDSINLPILSSYKSQDL